MSIIYDALKKVEKSNNIDLEVKPERKQGLKIKTYLVYIVIACAGIFIAAILFNFFVSPLKNKTGIVGRGQPAVRPRAVSKEMSLPETPVETQSAPSLILNGIFFSENEGYALINNRILKEGDEIKGLTVVRISLDEVELASQDSVIKLSTQNK